jgi:hypothetical protein
MQGKLADDRVDSRFPISSQLWASLASLTQDTPTTLVPSVVSAGVRLTHLAEVKVDHLSEDGSFLRAADADTGAVCGDQGVQAAGIGDPGDCARVGDLEEDGTSVPGGSGGWGYGPRAPRATKLSSFEGYLRERIEAARPDWIPATVVLRELKERGYEGLTCPVS